MLEEILDRRNIEKALVQVERNKGAAGIDGMRYSELRPYINSQWQGLKKSILEGRYKPQPVRKVEIPKPKGGTRMLGIPTVLDRMVQQAITQWLTPLYDPGFSNRSYGFRPNRNAHHAVLQAQTFINEGKRWIVELDLEKFFDRVNHDKLMNLLARKIADKRTLKLIRGYLSSGIMEGGVISTRSAGTPQGSPVSPILSNIVLNELDHEIEKRGHAFVRYADDCSLYVSSEKAAVRVKESITCFIETVLLLKVNREKTKISSPQQSTLLGFSFTTYKGSWVIKIARSSVDKMKEKCWLITKRNNPLSEGERIAKLNSITRGWVNYFVIAQALVTMRNMDSKLRSRLRMCKWKQWKKGKTRHRNLLQLGAKKRDARVWAWAKGSYCRVANSFILCQTLTVAYFRKQGYVGFHEFYQLQRNDKQFKLF